MALIHISKPIAMRADSRQGSETGSVSPVEQRAGGRKIVTFLRLTGDVGQTERCLENPFVGGSIPSRATKSSFHGSSCHLKSPMPHR